MEVKRKVIFKKPKWPFSFVGIEELRKGKGPTRNKKLPRASFQDVQNLERNSTLLSRGGDKTAQVQSGFKKGFKRGFKRGFND